MQTQAFLKISATTLGLALGLTTGIGIAQAQGPTCRSGYVWREARNGDFVCVTPRDRDDARRQNANARNNWEPGGGPYGRYTCRSGYVWREAYSNDVVCVTPHERETARQQNALSRQRTVSVRFD